MYVECTNHDKQSSDGVEGDTLEHMDVMYNRWSIQNPILLRQRILERYTDELLRKQRQTDLESKVVLNKDEDM
jgi:hypothetical protein